VKAIIRYNVYMGLIQKTVYIRQEDLAAWNSLPNKALFIHSALEDYNGKTEIDPTMVKNYLTDAGFDVVGDVKVEPIKGPKEVIQKLKEVVYEPNYAKFCKHGFDPKMCKFAKGGKPCK
jgi:hypothetical protein